MTEYKPELWVIVQVSSDHGTYYKVLASWYGGYLYGDSWKLSSGILDCKLNDDGFYELLQSSGSLYICHESRYGMSSYASSILEQLKTQLAESKKGSITLLSEEVAKLYLTTRGLKEMAP
jgi:hypothetical protein